MRDLELGRVVRALRRRRGWRQEDSAKRAGMHRSTWSLIERGRMDRITLETMRACLAVLEVRLELRPHWRGADLDRLLDQTHADLQAAWLNRLARRGWRTWVERSYNVYGERGRVDILAWHAETRTLLVVEIKSELPDAQSLLGTLDAKVRLAPAIARGVGLNSVARVVPMVVFKDSMTNRRRVARLAHLFAAFDTRGADALAWLWKPVPGPAGLLIFSNAAVSRLRGTNGQRVRRRRGSVSTKPAPIHVAAADAGRTPPSNATGGGR
jgi:transcriptional regulator with XRE-family HTH domain